MTMKNLWATHDFWTQKRTARQRSLRPKETVLARQLFQQPALMIAVNPLFHSHFLRQDRAQHCVDAQGRRRN